MTALLVGISCTPAVARPIYVDANAPPGGDGSSWAAAFKYLQDALADANANAEPNDIWVAEGIYTPDTNSVQPNGSGDRHATFQLINSVGLYGGFPSGGQPNWNDRDPNVNETILSGDINVPGAYTDNSYHVVTDSGTDANTVLDGFIITAGNANGGLIDDDGGGMYNSSGNLTIADCVFSENFASYGGAGMCNTAGAEPTVINCTFGGNNAARYGGGMYTYSNSSPTLTNCTFTANCAGPTGGGPGVLFIMYAGGGMSNWGGSVILSGCTFNANSSAQLGGGMFNIGDANLTNCIFRGNSAVTHGGGIYSTGLPGAILTNCIFSGNTAATAGAILTQDGDPRLTNCSFGENSASLDGGGIYSRYSGSPILTNCILWGNSDSGGKDESAQVGAEGELPDVNYCCIQGLTGIFGGTGNIGDDPCFADANGNDGIAGTEDDNLRLLPGSPCIDAGLNAGVPADTADLDNDGNTAERTPLDLDYGQRFADDPCTADSGLPDPPGYLEVVDMGAYEYRYYENTCWDAAECRGQGAGDATCDGNVDLADLFALKAHFAKSAPWTDNECCADFSHDGSVNLADLFALKAGFGSFGHSPSTVNQNCPP
ncbi:MAG: right-handed parallel beta-helix repeat-containing protein [Planctomycetota bacterium]|jgi:predicted outer membrane repeat protein